jgi:hypothetical protein
MRASSSGEEVTYPRSISLSRLRAMPHFLHRIFPAIPAAARFALSVAASIISKFLLPDDDLPHTAIGMSILVTIGLIHQLSPTFGVAGEVKCGSVLRPDAILEGYFLEAPAQLLGLGSNDWGL